MKFKNWIYSVVAATIVFGLIGLFIGSGYGTLGALLGFAFSSLIPTDEYSKYNSVYNTDLMFKHPYTGTRMC